MSAQTLTHQYRIGEAAALSGVSAANIRHYEREGMLPPVSRAENGYRFYNEQDIHRLKLIRLARSLDMSAEEIRTVVALDENRPDDCLRATKAIASHLGHVTERIAELQQLQKRLQTLLHACDGSHSICQTIESLHHQAETMDVQTDAGHGARPRHV